MTYIELIKNLYTINSKKNNKYNLKNMYLLSSYFSHPEKKFPSIHIAGTNGKGSVTTKIAKALELSGLKTGLYTSPHISSFRERIRINGQMISEAAIENYLWEIFSHIKKCNLSASFFEITTILAFYYFAKSGVDIAVIETGLGGRLDCTNIIQPKLSAITTISLEHTAILGKTLQEITREKAGIIKPYTPVVFGPKAPVDLLAPFAQAMVAPYIVVEGNFSTFDAENTATAKTCLELLNIDRNCTEEGCKIRPSCRMEMVNLDKIEEKDRPPAVILDVAHNPEGLTCLFRSIRSTYPDVKLRIVCGFSADKEISTCVSILKEYGTAFHPVEANSKRALSATGLYDAFLLQGVGIDRLFLKRTIQDNLESALHLAAINNELLIVCGSFFIMAPIREYLGIEEAKDPFELNEQVLPAR